jgi:hypothetical protein
LEQRFASFNKTINKYSSRLSLSALALYPPPSGVILSGLRTPYIAVTTSPSISNAVVCTGPSGESTTTPGRPLTRAKRIVKSSHHHASGHFRVTSTRKWATRSAPSMAFSAARTLHCCIKDWFRQPRADVLLVASTGRGQHIKTNSCRRGHEKSLWLRHVVAVGSMPAQVRFLYRVLSVGH